MRWDPYSFINDPYGRDEEPIADEWEAGPREPITVLERLDGERWSAAHVNALKGLIIGLRVKMHDDDYFIVIGGEIETSQIARIFGHNAFSVRKMIGEDKLPKKKNPRPRPRTTPVSTTWW